MSDAWLPGQILLLAIGPGLFFEMLWGPRTSLFLYSFNCTFETEASKNEEPTVLIVVSSSFHQVVQTNQQKQCHIKI